MVMTKNDWERAYDLSGIIMPFGKYAGMSFGDIPVRYLDETISIMPPTWIVRRAIEFVDLAWSHPLEAGHKTWSDMERALEELQERERKRVIIKNKDTE